MLSKIEERLSTSQEIEIYQRMLMICSKYSCEETFNKMSETVLRNSELDGTDLIAKLIEIIEICLSKKDTRLNPNIE